MCSCVLIDLVYFFQFNAFYVYCVSALKKCELGCGEELFTRKLYLHVRRDCPKRIVPCPRLCNASNTLKAEDVDDHLHNQCPERYKSCTLGCGAKLRLADMELHINKNCTTIRTSFCYAGCAVLASLIPEHEIQHLEKPSTFA